MKTPLNLPNTRADLRAALCLMACIGVGASAPCGAHAGPFGIPARPVAFQEGTAHVHVRNHTDHHLRVFVDDVSVGECDAHTDDLQFDVTPGSHSFKGLEEHGRLHANAFYTFTPGERFRWTVYNDHDEKDHE